MTHETHRRNQRLLEACHVSRVYAGVQPVTALSNINLTFQQGEFTSIIGPSGSGKSTLMNLLGLLDTPTGGTLRYLDQDVSHWRERQRAHFRNREIGFIFQAHLLLPEFTALENVLMPSRIGGLYNADTQAHAQKLLTRIGLGDRMHHRPGELSGGQNQRVAIARALANRPRIVFADEPTGALDMKTSLEVYELMREINREDAVTFIIVTHESELARRCDRKIQLLDGHVQSDEMLRN